MSGEADKDHITLFSPFFETGFFCVALVVLEQIL